METKVEEIHVKGDCIFITELGFNDYSKLARIRNARYESDKTAFAAAIERGLIELESDILRG